MANRYGRNQRRKHLDRIAELEREVTTLRQMRHKYFQMREQITSELYLDHPYMQTMLEHAIREVVDKYGSDISSALNSATRKFVFDQYTECQPTLSLTDGDVIFVNIHIPSARYSLAIPSQQFKDRPYV